MLVPCFPGPAELHRMEYLRRNTWRESEKIVCVSVRVGALGIVNGMIGKVDTPVTSYRIS